MKKILILMLLTISAVFTSINAQGFYLSFDGVDDHVSVPYDNSMLIGNNDFSIEIDLKIPNDNDFPIIFAAKP